MGDDYCAADTRYSGNNFTCDDNENNTTLNQEDVVHSSNVVIGAGLPRGIICSDNYYVEGCQTIYGGEGFPPALINVVDLHPISMGGVQPCYDADFHTISVGGTQPCYVEQQVYPVYSTDTTIPTWARIFICILLLAMLVIFIVIGKFRNIYYMM